MEITTNFTNMLLNNTNNYYNTYDVYHNPLSNLGKNWNTIAENPYLFNHEIDIDFKITDQKSSGRCWLFATLNLIRFIAAQNWNNFMDTKDLEFSQSYLFFWDKFERYNMYLNYYQDINLNKDTQYFVNLCKEPLGDGGQWDMAKDIILKYGIVPKYIYPDSYHAKNSAGMNKILTEMLKQDWVTLSKLEDECKKEIIPKMIEKVFNVLVKFLGKPPTKFNYEFKLKNKVDVWKDLTPIKLLEKSGFKADDWISIVNDPRKENVYNKYYQVEFLGNVKKQHVGWLNLPIERMKELTALSIDKNQPVWFGCDVGAHRDRESGVEDLDIIDYSRILNIHISMNKEERLRFYQSVPSHAMLITGYHKFENETVINRLKVENSWGSTSGSNGFLLMTNKWFDEYVFQIVINKEILKEEELNEINNVYKVLPPWDPLGTLAF
jgi:bleomycin hydrolase